MPFHLGAVSHYLTEGGVTLEDSISASYDVQGYTYYEGDYSTWSCQEGFTWFYNGSLTYVDVVDEQVKVRMKVAKNDMVKGTTWTQAIDSLVTNGLCTFLVEDLETTRKVGDIEFKDVYRILVTPTGLDRDGDPIPAQTFKIWFVKGIGMVECDRGYKLVRYKL